MGHGTYSQADGIRGVLMYCGVVVSVLYLDERTGSVSLKMGGDYRLERKVGMGLIGRCMYLMLRRGLVPKSLIIKKQSYSYMYN